MAFYLPRQPSAALPMARRRAVMLGSCMVATAAASGWARHRIDQGQRADPPRLDANIPRRFGVWQALTSAPQIVNPQTQQLLDSLYSEVVARTYVNDSRYHVMLSVAYGNDQRGGLEAHRPEVCYPAQGFTLQDESDAQLRTSHGDLQVRRLRTALGTREEPITYWFAMARTVNASAFDKRMARLRAVLTGSIPDGMLLRVSSIDPNAERAWRVQDAFIGALLDALPPATRERAMGTQPFA